MKNEKFEQFFGGTANKDSLDQFMAFLEMDDAEFDAIWPMFKESFKQMTRSEKFQAEQRESLLSIPDVSADQINAEKEFYGEILSEIKEDPTLSDNKKEYLELF